MCGVFYIDDETAREIERIARKIGQETAKAGEIHPSESTPVLRLSKDEMVSQVLQWGYEAVGKGSVIFNARSETVQEKPMFAHDYRVHRCVIPATKFYEWKKVDRKRKEKYEYFLEGVPLFLAGIYHKAPEGDRFTILTRKAEGCMEGIHDRMPVILQPGDVRKWLFSQEGADRLLTGHSGGLKRKESGQEGYRQLSLF